MLDIADAKRLGKVAKVLERIGIRIQKSFFQCEMERKEMEHVRDIILGSIKLSEDSFFVYQICENVRRLAIKRTGNRNHFIFFLDNFPYYGRKGPLILIPFFGPSRRIPKGTSGKGWPKDPNGVKEIGWPW